MGKKGGTNLDAGRDMIGSTFDPKRSWTREASGRERRRTLGLKRTGRKGEGGSFSTQRGGRGGGALMIALIIKDWASFT